MNSSLLHLVKNAFLCGFASAIVLHIPIIGGLWGLFSFGPLTSLFPEFTATGEHVEYGFLWLFIKSFYGWFVITAYYTVLWIGLLCLVRLLQLAYAKISHQNDA